ncbi:hypothetical protein HMI56_001107 [Coelomomyces lativittatus]|nr:hypothetical protein HMI56_001107 [Coelomomyces lativittatus]
MEELRIREKTDQPKLIKNNVLHVPPSSTPLSIPRDFFGRPLPTSTSLPTHHPLTSSVPMTLPPPRIHLKFNEGFSNAVRKPVYLKDLL